MVWNYVFIIVLKIFFKALCSHPGWCGSVVRASPCSQEVGGTIPIRAHACVGPHPWWGTSPVGVRVRGYRVIWKVHLSILSGFLKYFFREELNGLIGKPFKAFNIK